MAPDPHPLDTLDIVLGADPAAAASRALGHFEPRLPAAAAEAALDALVDRYRLRWAEYWGPVGDRVRMLEADGIIRVERGMIVAVSSSEPVVQLPLCPTGDVESRLGGEGYIHRRG